MCQNIDVKRIFWFYSTYIFTINIYIYIDTKKQMGIGIVLTVKNRWESVSLRCALSCEYGVHVNCRDLHDSYLSLADHYPRPGIAV